MTHTGRAIPDCQPLVSDLARAAALLRLELRDLEQAVVAAELPVWGLHAEGMEVFRWADLCAAAADAGHTVPTRKANAWRRRPAVVGRRVTPYGAEL